MPYQATINDPEVISFFGLALKKPACEQGIAAFLQDPLVLFLQNTGFAFEDVAALVSKHVTKDQFFSDPYGKSFLLDDVSFSVIDQAATSLCQVDRYDVRRIKALVRAAFLYGQKRGDCYLTLDQVYQIANRLSAQQGKLAKSIVSAEMTWSASYIKDSSRWYVKHIWEEEEEAAHAFLRLFRSKKTFHYETSLADTERDLNIHYEPEQKEAFHLLDSSGIKILTGPPGSGKTAIISGLIHFFLKNHNGKVALAATTGMAAMAMNRAIAASGNANFSSIPKATTLHKLLRIFPYHDSLTGRDETDPIDADLLIVDECSMMSLPLLARLLAAVKNGTCVILVGDVDQLPSVEYGNVLHDLMDTGMVPVCRLTKIMRQSGSICDNAFRVLHHNHQLTFDGKSLLRQDVDAGRLMQQLLSDYDQKQSQVICPMKDGPLGTMMLNRILQAKCNPNEPVICKNLRRNDKVIFTKTNYEIGYINGDMGTVFDKGTAGGLLVLVGETILDLPKESLPDVSLAYAITIHKAQGSEFAYTHVVMPKEARHMMTINLLYTAMTRAKQKVFLYTQENLAHICDTESPHRQTGLTERIRHLAEA